MATETTKQGIDTKTIIVIVLGILALVFIMFFFLKGSSNSSDKSAINLNVPPADKKALDMSDSINKSKTTAYEKGLEVQKLKDQQQSLDQTKLNLDMMKSQQDYANAFNAGAAHSQTSQTGNQAQTPVVDPALAEVERQKAAFFGKDTTSQAPPKPRAATAFGTTSEYNPDASRLNSSNSVSNTAAQGFTTVNFDGHGNPISGNSNSSQDRDVRGNVLGAAAGDVSADKQNVVATILRTQDIYSGSLLKIRLQDAVTVNNIKVPKNTIVTGRASVNRSRVEITVPSILVGGIVYDIGFQLYDQDGVIGLYIPDGVSIRAINQENLRTTANSALSAEVTADAQTASTQTPSANGTMPSSSLATGITQRAGTAISSILSRSQIKPLKITVPEGYKVLLRPYCEHCKN